MNMDTWNCLAYDSSNSIKFDFAYNTGKAMLMSCQMWQKGKK